MKKYLLTIALFGILLGGAFFLYAIGGLGRGGSERQLIELVAAAHPDRIEASIITLGPDCDPGHRATLDRLGVELIQMDPSGGPRALRPAIAVPRAYGNLRRLRPDVVYAWLEEAVTTMTLPAAALGIPLVVARRSVCGSPAERWTPFRVAIRRAEARAVLVTGNSEAVLDEAENRGISRPRLRLVRNGHRPVDPLPLPTPACPGDRSLRGMVARPAEGCAGRRGGRAAVAGDLVRSAWWGQYEPIYVLPVVLAVLAARARRRASAAVARRDGASRPSRRRCPSLSRSPRDSSRPARASGAATARRCMGRRSWSLAVGSRSSRAGGPVHYLEASASTRTRSSRHPLAPRVEPVVDPPGQPVAAAGSRRTDSDRGPGDVPGWSGLAAAIAGSGRGLRGRPPAADGPEPRTGPRDDRPRRVHQADHDARAVCVPGLVFLIIGGRHPQARGGVGWRSPIAFALNLVYAVPAPESELPAGNDVSASWARW